MKKLMIMLAVLILVLGGCQKPENTENFEHQGEISNAQTEKEDENTGEEEQIETSPYKSVDITYPESEYDMSVEAFAQRENDEYIDYLYYVVKAYNWPGVTGMYYDEDNGFELGEKFDSKILFNLFYAAVEEYYDDYYIIDDNGHEGMVILVSDIHAILDKYFEGYELDIHVLGENYEFLENDKYIKYPGSGLMAVVRPDRGGYRIDAVTDNGDGTVTAVIITTGIDEIDGIFVPNGKDESINKITFEPKENSCKILSYEIEWLQNKTEFELKVFPNSMKVSENRNYDPLRADKEYIDSCDNAVIKWANPAGYALVKQEDTKEKLSPEILSEDGKTKIKEIYLMETEGDYIDEYLMGDGKNINKDIWKTAASEKYYCHIWGNKPDFENGEYTYFREVTVRLEEGIFLSLNFYISSEEELLDRVIENEIFKIVDSFELKEIKKVTK